VPRLVSNPTLLDVMQRAGVRSLVAWALAAGLSWPTLKRARRGKATRRTLERLARVVDLPAEVVADVICQPLSGGGQ
jgi:hypothetical protein